MIFVVYNDNTFVAIPPATGPPGVQSPEAFDWQELCKNASRKHLVQ